MSKEYIHYGHDKFIRKLLINPDEMWPYRDKPETGLWGSPVDSNYGWKEFLENEQWEVERLKSFFYFTLTDDAKIFEIHRHYDADKYIYYNKRFECYALDSFGIKRDGYDGIEIFFSEDYVKFHYHDIFSTWDVDSIVVWNPDVIIPNYERRK